MKVRTFPLDVWGCGHFRAYWPGEAVAEQCGVDARTVEPDKRRVGLELDRQGRAVAERFPLDEGDVAVFQRPTHSFMPTAIRLLQKRGVAVVIDMDDDLANIHPSNPAWLMYHPKSRNGHSWHNAAESCRAADLVTVTTPQLARRYAPHGRVRVLPNMVPARYLTLDHEDSTTVGWAGNMQTHPDDLQQVGPAIARLVASGGRFVMVGDPRGVGRALGLGKDPASTGPVEFERYAVTLAATLGVGIAPLALTEFNQAKSRLKPLEYAACGIPWVGSPTEDYLAFHREGCGLIAEKRRDWEKILKRLTRDEQWRLELSARGREVAARCTYEGTAHLWAEAWSAAASLRRNTAEISA